MSLPRSRVLLDQQALADGLGNLAERLRKRLENKEVTAVPILGGGMFFAADLVRRLPVGLVMDFIRIGTYGDATSPQKLPEADWFPHPENIKGRTVLLLDDILDTGRTLQEARRIMLEEMKAKEALCVVLVDKTVRRSVAIEADDCVLTIEEDLFLVGCGLDFAGQFRNLPDLRVLESGAD